MTATKREKTIAAAFDNELRTIAFDHIAPLFIVPPHMKGSIKYKQIASSIHEIGLVEPLVVARDPRTCDQYTLLDGHLRFEVLKDRGFTEVRCLVSTDDEAFTYNKRINRLATIQEHKMILRALSLGVPEARLASALNIDIKTLKQKRQLLDGICDEAAELLKDKQVTLTGFQVLKKMKPLRQIEAAQLMVAMNKFTINYARSLLVATPENLLVATATPKQIKGISRKQLDLMERESANLEKEVRLAEDSYGVDHLDLVLARGYIEKLMSRDRITRYLALHHSAFLPAFEHISETTSFAS